MYEQEEHTTPKNQAEESSPRYGFVHISEDEKLREDIYRSGKEKLQLFTRMLRRNALLDKGSVRHAD